jgi:hypothetical protein
MLLLIHSALPRRLVGPPARQGGAMAEPIRCHLIISNLHDQLGLERIPQALAAIGPAAGPRELCP